MSEGLIGSDGVNTIHNLLQHEFSELHESMSSHGKNRVLEVF